MKKLMLIASVIMFSAATFGSLSSSGELQVSEALAGGTCCDGGFGTCYPTGCSSADCAVDNAWWRSDGKRCNDPFTEPVDKIKGEVIGQVNH